MRYRDWQLVNWERQSKEAAESLRNGPGQNLAKMVLPYPVKGNFTPAGWRKVDLNVRNDIKRLLSGAHVNLVIDLSEVSDIDGAGIRALVRGHTSAQRVGGTIRLAAVSAAVSQMLEAARLLDVFESYESVEAAQIASWPWRAMATAAGGVLLCGLLVWVGVRWAGDLSALEGGASGGATTSTPFGGATAAPAAPSQSPQTRVGRRSPSFSTRAVK